MDVSALSIDWEVARPVVTVFSQFCDDVEGMGYYVELVKQGKSALDLVVRNPAQPRKDGPQIRAIVSFNPLRPEIAIERARTLLDE